LVERRRWSTASPWENGDVESFNGKLRDALLDGGAFNTRREAQVLIEGWRRHDNRVPQHSPLGRHPPAPETLPLVRPPISSGAGAAAMAHQNSTRTTRWDLVSSVQQVRSRRWHPRQKAG
jgi:hypothetical protein